MPKANPYALRLPEVYARHAGTNTEKVLRLPYEAAQTARADLAAVDATADLAAAFGETLDAYGRMLNQPRGALTDTQYRYMLRNRIARNFATGTHQSVVAHAAAMLQANPAELVLVESADESGVVKVEKLPFAVLCNAGLTAGQAVAMLRQLVPAGVRVEAESFAGTFAFAAEADAYDQAAGFADAAEPERQTMGGYLGFAFGEDESTPLPL